MLMLGLQPETGVAVMTRATAYSLHDGSPQAVPEQGAAGADEKAHAGDARACSACAKLACTCPPR